MRASRSGVGGRGPSFPLARSSSPSRSLLLGSTMADRLPSLTSAPSLPDLPLSTLTSALTSLFLPHPPAADLGSASSPPRHRRPDPRSRPVGACVVEGARRGVSERQLSASFLRLASIPLRGCRALAEWRQLEGWPEPDFVALRAGRWPRRRLTEIVVPC
ncbi:uncharacterized protein [Symphalangus syndactylus]|uniref:uncharacterized protein n=1 Tax=Symphalangus syndactylus TaxID=9590 RepID=UPI003005D9DD